MAIDPPQIFFEHTTGTTWIRLVHQRGLMHGTTSSPIVAEISSPANKDAMGAQQWSRVALDDHAKLMAMALYERTAPFAEFSRKEWDASKLEAEHWKARSEYLMGVIKVAEEKDKVEKGHLQAEVSRLTSALAESQANVQRLEQERENEVGSARNHRRKKAG